MSNLKTLPFRIDAFAAACLGVLAIFAAVLLARSTDVAGGADSAGYLMSARLITEGRLTLPQRTIPELPADPWHYTPLGMIAAGPEMTLRPTYPIGLPLHFAAASTLAGWVWGPRLVNVLGAVAAVLLTYASARMMGARRIFAAASAACLAASPIVVFASLQPLSDMLSTTWNLAAFACALRARKTGRPVWGWACGSAVAIAVLVRPTDALIIPALSLVLWNWRQLSAAFLGGLPGAVFLLWYNNTLYGSPFLTGYGSIFGLVSPEWIARTLPAYATWIPLLLPAGMLGIVLAPWLPWRTQWRELTALFLWFFSFIGFFACYACTHETWWYMRFVLPAFPALAIAAAVGSEHVAQRPLFRHKAWLPVALAGLPLLVSLWISHGTLKRTGVWHMAEGQRPYKELCLWARDHLPADAVIASLHASCSLYFYTDFVMIRSDNFGAEKFAALGERLRASGRPTYALLLKHDDEPRRQELIPGDWVEVKRVGDFSLWRLEHR
jgi:hypothetical protein